MSAEPSHAITDLIPAPRPCAGLRNAAVILVIVGGLLSVAALISDVHRARFGFAYLWAFSFVWAVALGALFFVGLQHLVHAVWSVAVRRIAEMFAGLIWLVAILFVPLLLYCIYNDRFGLYPWLDANKVAHDSLLSGKKAYLNLPFFTVRAVVFFALWIAFAAYFTGGSLKQDAGRGGVEVSLRMRRTAAPFMMLFAVTATFASIDWLMSLEPLWFSTIFGVYVFSGMVVTSLSIISIATVWLRSSGRLGRGIVGDGHLYNLGVLLFGFVCFWAYIAFSQYMLIWYGNIPEESFYLIRRLDGGWLVLSIALALVRFVIPFLALLSRPAKINATRLVWVSVLLLLGQFLDLYWLIMPQIHHDQPVVGWPEFGPPLLMLGALALYISHFLKRYLPLAVGDPLPEMPVFLLPHRFVRLSLEPSYTEAFESLARRFRHVLEN
ncbi:MAG: hypothetical protein JSU63_06095 [Phycisphaerales bacterium]|nr:MAG: hypothetical protein JSU63_06095 [Phycisphaerales bacterium]